MAELINKSFIEYLIKKDPDMKTDGFAKAVKKFYQEEDDDELLEYALTLTPLAYKVKEGGHYDNCQTVLLCEIEDAPPPSEEDMKKIVTLWQLLDFEGHTLEIGIYGKFGHFIKHRNIQEYHDKITQNKAQ